MVSIHKIMIGDHIGFTVRIITVNDKALFIRLYLMSSVLTRDVYVSLLKEIFFNNNLDWQ